MSVSKALWFDPVINTIQLCQSVRLCVGDLVINTIQMCQSLCVDPVKTIKPVLVRL